MIEKEHRMATITLKLEIELPLTDHQADLMDDLTQECLESVLTTYLYERLDRDRFARSELVEAAIELAEDIRG